MLQKGWAKNLNNRGEAFEKFNNMPWPLIIPISMLTSPKA